MTPSSSFLSQLFTRRVVQWGVGYVVGAWAFLELMDFLAEMFGWSEVAVQVALTLLAFGLPAALVLSWYHGEPGRQRATRREVILVTIIAVMGLGTAARVATAPRANGPAVVSQVAARELPSDPREAAASVAVLPFVNLSADPDEDYFADGVTEDIISQLSRVPHLRVISRTSTMQYRNTTLGLVEIGRELNVDYILEGSARRVDDQVRIVAQLIDARTDEHVWSGSYDRELSDILRLQDEVAGEITHALSETLQITPEPRFARDAGTVDGEAYRTFLRGRRLVRSADAAEQEEGERLLAQALEMDPTLNAVRGALAEALLPPGTHPAEIGDAPEEGSRRFVLVQRHLKGPGTPPEAGARVEWRLALARGESERAREALLEALTQDPNDAQARRWYGVLLAQEGRTEDALEQLEIARVLNPHAPELLADMGEIMARAGRAVEAAALVERLMESGASGEPRALAVARIFLALGDSAQAVAWFERAGVDLARIPGASHQRPPTPPRPPS